MSWATQIVLAAAEEGEHSGNLFLETMWFPIVAMAVFGALALVTVSYRNVANRHSDKAEAYARTHAAQIQQQAGHGH